MVDVAGDIFSRGAVDGFSITNLEKILAANAISFFFVHDIAPILNDEPSLRNGDICKHA